MTKKRKNKQSSIYFIVALIIFLIVGVCFLVSVILVHIMRKIAIYMDITDKPNERKMQKEPVPLLGGIGIYLAFLTGYMLFAAKNDLMFLAMLVFGSIRLLSEPLE